MTTTSTVKTTVGELNDIRDELGSWASTVSDNYGSPTDIKIKQGYVVIALNLKKENTIEVRVPCLPTGVLVVRVTQITEADFGLLRQGYFGLNSSDMVRQRAFYETLGFIGEIYPAGSETRTTFAQSLGFPEDYLIHVSLHSLTDPSTQPFVDTVQFRGNSYREEPPYANPNHIGMAYATYATYATTDLDGNFAYLHSEGVEFVSAPTVGLMGRFVFFKDQGGIFLKLIETIPKVKGRPPVLT